MRQEAVAYSVAAGLALVNLSAGQAVVLYSDPQEFATATGAVAEPALPNLGRVSVPFSHGSLSYSYFAPGFELYSGEWSVLHAGAELAISGPENLRVSAGRPIHALGFSIVEPTSGSAACSSTCPCVDTTFELSILSSQAGTLARIQFNATNDALAFVGVASAIPFDRIEIKDLTNTCDNEYFGSFVVSECLRGLAFGTGSSGTGGTGSIPTLVPGVAFPQLGALYALDGAALSGGARGALLLAIDDTHQHVLGVELLVDLAVAIAIPITAGGAPGVAGAGSVSVPLPIPNSTPLIGSRYFAQIVALEPLAPLGLSSTNGVAFTICR